MKKIIALTFLVSFIAASLNAATVAYYKFSGTGTVPTNTIINDLAGSHNGTVVGGELVYGTDPLMGGYLSFDPDGADRIVIPHAPDLVFSADQGYTFEAVFRMTQTGSGGSGTNGALISKGCDVSNPDSQYWIRHQGNGTIRGLVEGVGSGTGGTENNATSTTSTLVNDGGWHHMAFVCDGPAKKLRIYIDGSLHTTSTITTTGLIGGADNDPLIIGEFASLNTARGFGGDIAAIRLSDAALAPEDFLQVAATYVANLTPKDGSMFLPATTVAGFQVKSPSVGVASSNIKVWVNGVDVSGQLTITGSTTDWNVTLPALAANKFYSVQVEVTDQSGNLVRAASSFNTFSSGLVFIEGEDYNFQGQFIDNIVLSSTPGSQNYLDRLGTEGVDYHQTNTPVAALYRIGDQVATAVSQDIPRQAYIDAQATDPGVADYIVTETGNTEWLNYTRTFPANTYKVYARVGKGGTAPITMSLDEVTSGSSGTTQTLFPIGRFKGQPTGAAQIYTFVPLVDALGNDVSVRLSGTKTLRLTMVSGCLGLNLNYLLFVPAGEAQAPYLSGFTPATDNELPNVTIQANIRNGDTTVNSGSIAVKLNGSTVAANSAPTSSGATVSYTPSTLSTGAYNVVVSYSDSSSKWFTNQWTFRVANQAVRGYWKFDEKAPGNAATTNTGSFLDFSGNERNGTAVGVAPEYVQGSPDYGSTSALRFNAGGDRVVVPDPFGDFNFTNSFTLEAVLRTTNTVAGGAIMAKNGTDGEGEYWWRMPGAGAKSQQMWVNGKGVTGTNVVNDGKWHHVAAVYDISVGELRTYFDYKYENTVTNLPTARVAGRPNDLTIGSFWNGGSEFVGDVDFIRITEGALSPAEFVQASPAAPTPLLTSVTVSGGNIGFSFATQSGHNYTVLSTDAMGGSWAAVETFAGTDGNKSVSYPASGSQKFYRVRVD